MFDNQSEVKLEYVGCCRITLMMNFVVVSSSMLEYLTAILRVRNVSCDYK